MRFLLSVLFLASSLWAQNSLSLASPVTTVKQGLSFPANINYSPSNALGLQWTLAGPGTFTAAIGPQGTAAGKSLACTAPGTLCLVTGLNQTPIPAGTVATYTVLIPTSQPLGPVTLTLSGQLAVNLAGTGLAVTVGPPLSILVVSKFDLNNSGIVDQADVNLAIDQALGNTACGSADLTGPAGTPDGKCDLLDVQAVIRAAQGL